MSDDLARSGPRGRGEMAASHAERSAATGRHHSARSRSPFGPVVPSVAVAIAFAVATAVWATAGPALPGGRWLAVHLFTLGVLTNLVVAFTQHFARTLTRSPRELRGWPVLALNIGVLLVLLGIPTGSNPALAIGATVVTAVVLDSYRRIRRMRREAVGARFGWIVRIYERAHGAFVHGAILGALLGMGLLAGEWYGAARVAHLHINVLGWGGLTLLATLVFFGPSMVRARIVDGADDRAARALRHGATALTVAALLLLATGFGGTFGTGLRVAAAAGLAAYAWSATVVCWPVVLAAWRAEPSATRWPTIAASVWFPFLVWADAFVIATGTWRHLTTLGLAVLIGVLLQAIATVLVFVAPMLRGADFATRDGLLARFERGSTARTAVYNLATAAIVFAVPIGGAAGGVLARAGWVLLLASLVWLLITGLLPIRVEPGSGPRSQVARRHRAR
jgi:nitrite reductase (NO-forming)